MTDSAINDSFASASLVQELQQRVDGPPKLLIRS